ncbi:MAG: hemerythrin domain-containing protein [Nitrospirae bacterium]|nr:hemerythrin domain-containing protein [Nitrospirota bacterium]
MSTTTDAIRNHHRSLLNSLAGYTDHVLSGAQGGAARDLAAFLNEELLPHAQGEELHLYPALNPILRDHADATATMSMDHQWIENTIRQIDEIARTVPLAPEVDRPVLRERLSRLALQLLAVVTLHVRKEEEGYLPIMERHMSDEAQRDILERMHSAAEVDPSAEAPTGHGQCHCACGGHDARRTPNL